MVNQNQAEALFYKGINVEFIQLVSYMGEEWKTKTFKENQAYFKKSIHGKFPFSCFFECPVEDMICLYMDDTKSKSGKEERDILLSGLEELKKVFPQSFINLNLSDFIEGEGNCIDLTAEEFKELYC